MKSRIANLSKSLLIVLLIGQVGCLSFAKTIKPDLIKFQGKKYWLIDVKKTEGKLVDACLEEDFYSDGHGIFPLKINTGITGDECLAKVREGVVFFELEDYQELETWIIQMQKQYNSL